MSRKYFGFKWCNARIEKKKKNLRKKIMKYHGNTVMWIPTDTCDWLSFPPISVKCQFTHDIYTQEMIADTMSLQWYTYIVDKKSTKESVGQVQ